MSGDEPGDEPDVGVPRAVDEALVASSGLCVPLTYVYGEPPPRFAFEIPKFVALGEIHFNTTPSIPPTKWQKRKWRWKAKRNRVRERVALFIAPWLEDRDPYGW